MSTETETKELQPNATHFTVARWFSGGSSNAEWVVTWEQSWDDAECPRSDAEEGRRFETLDDAFQFCRYLIEANDFYNLHSEEDDAHPEPFVEAGS